MLRACTLLNRQFCHQNARPLAPQLSLITASSLLVSVSGWPSAMEPGWAGDTPPGGRVRAAHPSLPRLPRPRPPHGLLAPSWSPHWHLALPLPRGKLRDQHGRDPAHPDGARDLGLGIGHHDAGSDGGPDLQDGARWPWPVLPGPRGPPWAWPPHWPGGLPALTPWPGCAGGGPRAGVCRLHADSADLHGPARLCGHAASRRWVSYSENKTTLAFMILFQTEAVGWGSTVACIPVSSLRSLTMCK